MYFIANTQQLEQKQYPCLLFQLVVSVVISENTFFFFFLHKM